MTVARLDAEMGYDEFVAWSIYYGRKQQREELADRMSRARGRR